MNKPLFQQLQNVQRKIESSARKSGQDPTVIQLIAVSKGVSTDLIREAYDAGQRDFGENYAQEMKEKAALLHDLEIRWHFIGHLQRNKVKLVAPITTSIVIDSMKTAVAIDLFRNSMVRVCAALSCCPPVLVLLQSPYTTTTTTVNTLSRYDFGEFVVEYA